MSKRIVGNRGKILIIRSLERLKSEGIDRVVIVTGFQDTMYHKHLEPLANFQRLNLFTARVLLKPEVCTRFL